MFDVDPDDPEEVDYHHGLVSLVPEPTVGASQQEGPSPLEVPPDPFPLPFPLLHSSLLQLIHAAMESDLDLEKADRRASARHRGKVSPPLPQPSLTQTTVIASPLRARARRSRVGRSPRTPTSSCRPSWRTRRSPRRRSRGRFATLSILKTY